MAEIHEMPSGGRVIVAHPSARIIAGVYAVREGLDFMLSSCVPTARVFIVDVDGILNGSVPA